MSFMRSFIALTVLLVAVAVGFGAMGAHWVDRLARTPAPLQRIIGPLVSDSEITAELSSTLTAEAKKAVPAEMLELPLIGEQINQVITVAVVTALADPGVQRAWNESINRSRVAYVKALDAVREDETLEAPTIWFDLSPFAQLGKAKLMEVSAEPLHPYLDQVQLDEVRLPLGQPSESITQSIADGVGAARNWPWFYAAAGALAVIGLVIGSRRGRWVALLLAAAAAAVGLWFGRLTVERVAFPEGDSLAAAVRTRIVEGGTQSFLDFTQPALYVVYGLIGLSLLALLLAGTTRRS
ncbi:hypothetical protein [Tessaracoccus sp. MC1756]|uniref:hypothetical protein n=1 Tax=Tessaracoccus sp. MC1756 TaxID=2760311 RepID=UPI001602E66E|nr:hypothetical protein [Tessaracoccus sp. MC1756]MBB1510774.1 hypothetical protein [Tessaracoccus sp. MC1756]